MSRPSPQPTKRVAEAKKLLDSGHHFMLVDAPAETLLKLSDWAKDKDVLFFNIRATDVSLRQEDCRANIMHVAPDRYMLADALAQYLVVKKWTNWLLVYGSTPGDLAYADAIKRAASRFGANIVDAREYKDVSGGRRDDVGTIPPGKQASNDAAFAANPDYQIIVVADEDQLFGPYMPYRGGADARPVAGTTGLTATTWSPGHEKWGATQMNNHFQKDYNRLILPIDYQAYVAARTIGEAVTRNDGESFATIAAFIHGPRAPACPVQGHQAAIPALGRSVPAADPDRDRQGAGVDLAAAPASRMRAIPRSRWTRSASTSLRASARCKA